MPGSAEGGPHRRDTTDTSSLAEQLPDIVATLIAAGPLLVQAKLAREEAERQRQIAEQLRYREQQRRKSEKNRLRRFTELAQAWRELNVARDFLATLKALPADTPELIDGRSLGDWLVWAEQQLQATDPLADGVAGVFRNIGNVSEWSYRD